MYSDQTIPGAPNQGWVPRSFALWMTAGYVALFILRPWEGVLSAYQDFHLERYYALCMIVVVMLSGGFRLELNLQTSAILALMAALGLATADAIRVDPAFDKYYEFLTVIVCYFVLVSVIRTPYDLCFIIGSYLGATGLYLALSYRSFYLGGGWWDMGVERLGGIDITYANPNAVACTIVVSLPFWLWFWRCRRDVAAQWPATLRKLLTCCLAIYVLLRFSA